MHTGAAHPGFVQTNRLLCCVGVATHRSIQVWPGPTFDLHEMPARNQVFVQVSQEWEVPLPPKHVNLGRVCANNLRKYVVKPAAGCRNQGTGTEAAKSLIWRTEEGQVWFDESMVAQKNEGCTPAEYEKAREDKRAQACGFMDGRWKEGTSGGGARMAGLTLTS